MTYCNSFDSLPYNPTITPYFFQSCEFFYFNKISFIHFQSILVIHFPSTVKTCYETLIYTILIKWLALNIPAIFVQHLRLFCQFWMRSISGFYCTPFSPSIIFSKASHVCCINYVFFQFF